MAGEAENGDERDRERPPSSPHDPSDGREPRPARGRDERGRGRRNERRDGSGGRAGSDRGRFGGRGQGRPRGESDRGGRGRPKREGERPGREGERPGREGEHRRGGQDRPRGEAGGYGSTSGGRDRRPYRDEDRRSGGDRRGRPGPRPDRSASRGERGPRQETDHRRPLPRGGARPPQADRPLDPPIDEDVTFSQLDRQARQRLRTLSKESAERVGRHLVMAGLLVEDDPELAYQHAHSAVRRAGRVDVVREAVALTAYATGRYAEALREIRTVRRLSGLDALRAIEADCERGLGRPERALALAAAPPSKDMTAADRVELALVASGARLDLGQPDAALLLLDQPFVLDTTDDAMRVRVTHARVSALRAAGREEEAAALEATIPEPEPEDEDVSFTVIELTADAGEPAPHEREDDPADG